LTGFLIDTNVVSELRKGERADPGVRGWFSKVDAAEIWLSVLVVGEIRRGIESIRKRDPKSAATLERWLVTLVKSHVRRILPVDAAIAELWGRLDASGRVPVVDGLLAATAILHDLTLVTRNVKDVAKTNVSVLNPFAKLPIGGGG
jgi:toxin FitB